MKISDITDKELSKVGVNPDKLIVKQFDNLAHYASYIEGIKDVSTYKNSSQQEGAGWSGTSNFEDALDLILRPNLEPPEDVRKGVENIEMKIRNNLKKKGLVTDWIAESYKYDVEGIEIDIAKLIEGDPECYLKPNLKYKSHFYDLHINFAVNAGVSIDTQVEALSKVVSVVSNLEKKDYKIRLFATGVFRGSGEGNQSIIISTMIKRYDDFIDIKKIARVLYPSFLRRIAFKVLEVEFQDKLQSGYGQAVSDLTSVITLDNSLKEEALYNKIVEMAN